jgi:CheY-like chemotaxis protein
MRKMIVRVLREGGLKLDDVREAANGVEALAALRAGLPHLIVCDVSMPKMDGLSFIAEVRKKHPPGQVRILVLTAAASADFDPTSPDLRVDAVMEKPFVPGELVAQAKTLLGRQRSTPFASLMVSFALPPPFAGAHASARAAKLAGVLASIAQGFGTLLDKPFHLTLARAECGPPRDAFATLGSGAVLATIGDDEGRFLCGSALELRLAALATGVLLKVPAAGIREQTAEHRLPNGVWTETGREIQNIAMGRLRQALTEAGGIPPGLTVRPPTFDAAAGLPPAPCLILGAMAEIGDEEAGRLQVYVASENVERL